MAAAPGINLCTYSADISDNGSLAHLLSSLPILTRLTSQPFVSLNAIGNCIRAVQMCFIGFLGTVGLRICFVSKNRHHMWSLGTETFLLILFLQCHQSLRSIIVPHLHSRYPRQPLRACGTGSRTLTQMKVKQCEIQSSPHINSPSPSNTRATKTHLMIFKVLNTHSFPTCLTAGTRRPLQHTRGISKMGFRRAHRSTGVENTREDVNRMQPPPKPCDSTIPSELFEM